MNCIKYLIKKFIFSFCAVFLFAHSVNAQSLTVSGTVSDASGALPGVNVWVRGVNTGQITDDNGRFTIAVANEDAVLIFSFVGYQTQEIVVGNQRVIDVTMSESASMLDEVVVIGYGSLQRRQVTSSITSLSENDLPVGSGGGTIAEVMRGRVAGLVISGTSSPNTSGNNNTYQLRGMASINTSRAPLIVIDGMPGGDIRSLVQEEIQSIDILKDASAGAIYGTRATGGVILITTKRPQAGRLRMSYTGELIFKQPFGKPDMLNRDDYVATYGGAKNDEGHSTDWWDEALNDNPTSHRHVVTLQGGTENARIFASLTYDNNKGVWRGDSREDYAGRINTDFKTLEGWLDITGRVNYRQALRQQNRPPVEGIMRANPTQAVRDPDSQTGWNIWTDGDNTEMNEVGEWALRTDTGLDKWFRPDISLQLNILPIPGLTYRHTIAYENRQWEQHRHRSMFTREELRAGRTGQARLDFSKTELFNTDGYLSYDNFFGVHSISAVAGYSYYERNNESFWAENFNFTNDRVRFWNIGEGTFLTEGRAGMGSNKGITQRLFAQFARFNYSYDDRYMASASVRREGSSKFAEQNRWGIFWQVSAGWRISSESFMQNLTWIDDLKVRVAYGVTGNEGFDADYAARMYGSDTRWLLPTGAWAMSYGLRRNVNNELGWEEKHEWNIGIDFSVFNQLFYGKFDLYNRGIKGLIYNVQVPQPPNTESTMYKNIGTMENRGFEIEVGANIVRTNDTRYSTSFNLSHNKTFIGDLWGDATFINGFWINNWVENVHRIEEGTEVGNYFIYRHAGISDEGRLQIYNRDDDIILADNGRVDDRVYQKNFMPSAIIGWNHNVTYKNWSFSATLTSWVNFDIFNGIEVLYGLKNVAQGNMTYDAIRKNYDITGRPTASDYFVYDGTFLKLQNLSLGYNIPLRNYTTMIDNIRLYFAGHNLVTLTSYPGLDPEVNITGWEGGVERASTIYPQTRTFTFGIQMNF